MTVNNDIYKICIAGLLHDIGKFIERANPDYIDNNFENKHSTLYLPYNRQQNRHTHKHAIYTAKFIDYLEKKELLPQFLANNNVIKDSLFNLATSHHKPADNPFCWLVTLADRIASGFERDEFSKYNEEIDVRDYRNTRLLTIFEQISISNNYKEDSISSYRYRYPLKKVSPYTIFPQELTETSDQEYFELFQDFENNLEILKQYVNHPYLWLDCLINYLMIYTSHIPAATVGYTIPDISLFDHLRTTACLALALFKYHEEDFKKLNSDEILRKIQNYEEKKFLIISGDFYGIQNFIFSEGGATNKNSAKLLRGRSFYVSLLSELLAEKICEKVGLTSISILLNAAGKFTIIAQNTNDVKENVQKIEQETNEWLIKNFYGETSFGISFVEVSPKELISTNFPQIWEKIADKLEVRKFKKVDIEKYGGCLFNYLNSFRSDINEPLCRFCGKRPSYSNGDEFTGNEAVCKICHDQIKIGTYLTKNKLLVVSKNEEGILQQPIFEEYQIDFFNENELRINNNILKLWEISISSEMPLKVPFKPINSYIPKFEQNEDKDLLFYGEDEEYKNILEKAIESQQPKSFHEIAKYSLSKKDNKFVGLEAIAVLKADVDNLGSIFSVGLPDSRQNLSKLASLSRQLNNYFTIYIPFLISTNIDFKNIYTVFSGGDDLFLIGPWNKIIMLAEHINNTFKEYVCQNSEITISMGITLHKPDEPIRIISESVEHAINSSKNENIGNKNSITIFGETVKWEVFYQLQTEVKNEIENWFNTGKINKSMLYRLLEIINMAITAKQLITNPQNITLKHLNCLKWRAICYYTIVRNFKTRNENEIEEAISKIVSWIENYNTALKIPVFYILYSNRGG